MKTYIVDSFTNRPFSGNPAGICFCENEMNDEWMQAIAREFGLSETAFVWSTEHPGIFRIRYFSPKKEIPLCGHATLATAKIIFTNFGITEINFITGQGVDLYITGQGEEIIMEFPVYNTIPIAVPDEILSALGISYISNAVYSEMNKIILLEIDSPTGLAQLQPDFNRLLESQIGINGVLVTAASGNDEYDYHYRYFWPWAGTNEDPVTGGVQTFLAKYWSDRINKTRMRAFQSSARTGSMKIELKKDKVLLTGEAVIIFAGDFVAPEPIRTANN